MQGAEAEVDTTLGVGLKLITTSSSSTSRRITPSSCRDKLKQVLHELLKGTPLDEYSNVVTTLFQDAGENNVDASGEDMVSSITSILQTEFMD